MKLLVAILLGTSAVLAQDCATKQKTPNPGCWDIDEKGNAFQVTSPSDCNQKKYNDRCCFRNGNCEACNVIDEEDECEMMKEYFREKDEPINKSALAGAKSLEILSPFLPNIPLHCLPPVPFPGNCEPQRNEPYVLSPPVNIPYCVRIPCKASDNQPLETNHRACGVQPGCYFDVALFELRQAFGPSVLSGVPVCHLAIRNKAFQDNAKKVISKFGSFNPYFTNCLLNEYDSEIRKGPVGCELIRVLETFHVTPKMAGWKNIASYSCALIDACWLPQRGCFYPVDISNVRVKSGERSISEIRQEVAYGRPRCQTFDTSSPISILKSYHKCMSAGCSVDHSVTRMYYSNLFKIGQELPTQNHWDYWSDVGKGLVGPFNIPEVLGEYGYVGGPGPTTPPSGSNTLLPPGGNTFVLPPPSSVGSESCGPAHKAYGGRPCPPKFPPFVPKKSHCPYKPFFVPRFKKLEGSFDGCCEINLCYLPKKEISNMHSGPAHYFTEWTAFSECSVTCGPGLQKRYRKCVSNDRKLCEGGKVEDMQPCFGTFITCGQWSQWNRWTPCPRTCYPGGNQVRRRICFPRGSKCDGHDEEARSCNEHACNGGGGEGSWAPWKNEPCLYLGPQQGKCQTSKVRYCMYQGNFAGNCVGASTQTQRYSCNGC